MNTARMLLPVLLILSSCGGGRSVDFGDNPRKAVAKTDPHLTAPPPELANGSATEAGHPRP